MPSGSIQAIEKPSYTLSASVSTISQPMSVRAVDRATNAGIAELTETHRALIDNLNNDTLPDIFLVLNGKVQRGPVQLIALSGLHDLRGRLSLGTRSENSPWRLPYHRRLGLDTSVA
jgi:hypothetical protein